jgi:hypothetical protein
MLINHLGLLFVLIQKLNKDFLKIKMELLKMYPLELLSPKILCLIIMIFLWSHNILIEALPYQIIIKLSILIQKCNKICYNN